MIDSLIKLVTGIIGTVFYSIYYFIVFLGIVFIIALIV